MPKRFQNPWRCCLVVAAPAASSLKRHQRMSPSHLGPRPAPAAVSSFSAQPRHGRCLLPHDLQTPRSTIALHSSPPATAAVGLVSTPAPGRLPKLGRVRPRVGSPTPPRAWPGSAPSAGRIPRSLRIPDADLPDPRLGPRTRRLGRLLQPPRGPPPRQAKPAARLLRAPSPPAAPGSTAPAQRRDRVRLPSSDSAALARRLRATDPSDAQRPGHAGVPRPVRRPATRQPRAGRLPPAALRLLREPGRSRLLVCRLPRPPLRPHATDVLRLRRGLPVVRLCLAAFARTRPGHTLRPPRRVRLRPLAGHPASRPPAGLARRPSASRTPARPTPSGPAPGQVRLWVAACALLRGCLAV
ncbi:hypothetical protein VPH35_001249 [Triticum aestivum]